MRGQRGTTLIELMVAGLIILVALLGFVASMNDAAHATAVGHRRTVAAQLRGALLDRLAVTPRDRIAALPANKWIVDGCYDLDATLVAANSTLAASFACPTAPAPQYRSWIRVEPHVDAAGNALRTWAVRTYVERSDQGCDDVHRFTSLYCVAGDVLLTD
jgi:hypothetical protein